MLKFVGIVAALAALAAVHGKGILKVADRRVVAGDTVQVSGEKFPKAATVVMLLVGPSGRTPLDTIRTDTSGRFRVVPLIPADLPTGTYRIIVLASDGDEVGALDVEIVPAAQRAHPAGHMTEAAAEPSAQPLPLQRARSPVVSGGALAFIVVGGIAGGLLLRRPRRIHAQ